MDHYIQRNTEKNIKTLNTLGQLVKEELYNNEKHILSKEINYKKTVESNSTRCYNIINDENISFIVDDVKTTLNKDSFIRETDDYKFIIS